MPELTSTLSLLQTELAGDFDKVPSAVVRLRRLLIVRNQHNDETARLQAEEVIFLYKHPVTIAVPNHTNTALRSLTNRGIINEKGDHVWLDPNAANPSVEFL